MSIFTSRPALRWLVPAAVTAAVLGGGAAVRTLSAVAEPSLPERSAAQLLVDLQTARLDGLSGTVVQRADLGLPALPGMGGQGSAELSSLVSGSHTLRVWYAGPDRARVALLGTLGESDVVRDGRDVWTWSSRTNTATHRTLPPGEAGTQRPDRVPDAAALPRTPQEAADAALAAIDPSTKVSTGGSARVAGRAAYELVLQPRDTGSLVGQVRLAIDADQHVPLRVQVYPRGYDAAAFEVAFTQVSFARPDAAQFRFTPPPGAKVTEEQPGQPAGGRTGDAGAPGSAGPAGTADRQVAVIGTGWTSVLVARLPQGALTGTNGANGANGSASGDTGDRRGGAGFTLDALPAASGTWGSGHLLSGRLFSVLVTDDGRVLVGAVSPQRLFQAAADPAAALKAGR
jgi:outer membrane lipoprotein-sorting protein